jgi:hypothetical protein
MSDLTELELRVDELEGRCKELDTQLEFAQDTIAHQFLIMSALARLADYVK